MQSEGEVAILSYGREAVRMESIYRHGPVLRQLLANLCMAKTHDSKRANQSNGCSESGREVGKSETERTSGGRSRAAERARCGMEGRCRSLFCAST